MSHVPISDIQIDKIIKNLQSTILPSTEEALQICAAATRIFLCEPSVLRLGGPLTVVGDIHGQFYDLLNIFRLFGSVDCTRYVFLGDIVDRGANSVETILLLLCLKVRHPTQISILRGNHESTLLTATYGFKTECEEKYDIFLYCRLCELFETLPLCAVVDGAFFCIHGGIYDTFDVRLLESTSRFGVEAERNAAVWSDPWRGVEFFSESPRGAGQLFGQGAVDAFLKVNGFKCIVRSHQLVDGGYEESLKDVFTVWSAPNYCYVCGNMAAVGVVDGGDIEFRVFGAVENQRGL